MNYSKELENKILDYYSSYYKSCGLKDYLQRAEVRLKEEETELERMKRLQSVLGFKFNDFQKHFIFGAGTGGLAVALNKKYGVAVSGIEPCSKEFEIIQEKLKEKGIIALFKKEYGENLSFDSNQFDVVHCFTVLEHVKDVKKCLSEMIRIIKPGGSIYINTPNYASFEERHYKLRVPFPLAYTPRILSYLYFILRGRPYKFLKDINFLTERKMDKMLSSFDNIVWLRVHESYKRIYPKQEIIIKKHF